MRFLTTLFSTVVLAAKRIWNHRLLMLCLLAGLVASVGLLSSIPLYAEAAQHQLLHGELTEAGTYRPPFSFLWRYVGAWHGEQAWDAFTPVDQYLSQQVESVIGLPSEEMIRHIQTESLRLFPANDTPGFSSDEPLLWTNLGFISGLQEHIDIIEGRFPELERGSSFEGDVPVLVSQDLAERLGLLVGERYILFGRGAKGAQIPVSIAGVWQPRNSLEDFWFYQPAAFAEVLLTSESIYEGQVVPALDKPVSLAVWYQIADGSQVRTSDVEALQSRIAQAQSRVTALLDQTVLESSPAEALGDYQQAARSLTVMLTMFGVPTVAVVLYFIGLIAGMVVRRGQSEIASLRSRGATRAQIVGIFLLEGSLVGVLGLVFGMLFGRWLAGLMGQTRTFLDLVWFYTNQDPSTLTPLPIAYTPTAVIYGLLGAGLALLALLIPALGASRYTIVTFKWERARALLRPFWQRYYLDLLLLLPVIYGLYVLRQEGTITTLSSGDDPFSNPLLFLVPALFCFSLALLFARSFPWLMGALAWVAGHFSSTVPLLTLRQLARATGLYTGPLLLLALTLSLATFTASMAVTLDSHLHDRVYYQVGADLKLVELGESTETEDDSTVLTQSAASQDGQDDADNEPRWLFLPASEHLQIDGVKAVARVGDYSATSNIGGKTSTGRLLGVDRTDFPKVGFFRPDFAEGEPLGELMNRLALDSTGILVGRDFLARHRLTVGDPLVLTVTTEGDAHEIDFTIVGALELFPTLYPQDGPFFVANLDYVHEEMGGIFPYDVWLKTDPTVSGEQITADARSLGMIVVTSSESQKMILSEQTRPERQGIFGLLSVGFLAAAALTVLGFLVYAVVSFRQRFIELGMLRAVGLSTWQMAGYLTAEQALLILTGAGLGTALGVWASSLFIPYFQVGTDKVAHVPPFVVEIAWNQLLTIYAVFGVMFVIAVSALVALLLRMKVFVAVKLGEVG